MKTKDAKDRAGGHKELAALVGVSSSAVSQWPENLPRGREWQLRVLRPEWFIVKAKKPRRASRVELPSG